MSKKKNVIARVGNFEITKEKTAYYSYVRIKSISGSWGLTFRDDTPMYGMWVAMCKDPEYKAGIEVLLTMSYSLTNMPLDKEFAEDFFNALDAMNQRRVANSSIPTEQEEADAIAEVQALTEAQSVLSEKI